MRSLMAVRVQVGLLLTQIFLSAAAGAHAYGRRQGLRMPLADAAKLQAQRDRRKHNTSFAHCAGKSLEFSLELSAALTALQICRHSAGITTQIRNAPKTEVLNSVTWGDGLSHAVVGMRATFGINTFDAHTHALRTGGDPFFWSRLIRVANNRTTVYPVRMSDLGNGTYRGSFTVLEAGIFKLTVARLGHDVPGSPFAVHASCCSDTAKHFIGSDPLTGDDKFNVQHLGCHDVDNHACAELLELSSSSKCNAPHPTDFANGRWVDDIWQPLRYSHHCATPWRITRGTMERCLARRAIDHILLVGDSLLRCAFWTMAAWLRGRKMRNHYDGYDAFYSVVPAITGHTRVRLTYQQAMGSSFAAGYIHTDESKPAYLDGTQAAGLPSWFGIKLGGSAKQLPPGSPLPSAVVLSVAAHDMIVDDVEAYTRNIDSVMWKLRVAWKFSGPILWVGASSPVPEKLKQHFPHYAFRQTFAKTREFNTAARSVADRWGVPFFDIAHLTAARPELSFDGQHYVNQGDPLKDPVYVAVANMLLQHMCEAPTALGAAQAYM